eukprot:SAG11_NODE_30_length_23132_cov_22.413277_20_plen_202_part_00
MRPVRERFQVHAEQHDGGEPALRRAALGPLLKDLGMGMATSALDGAWRELVSSGSSGAAAVSTVAFKAFYSWFTAHPKTETGGTHSPPPPKLIEVEAPFELEPGEYVKAVECTTSGTGAQRFFRAVSFVTSAGRCSPAYGGSSAGVQRTSSAGSNSSTKTLEVGGDGLQVIGLAFVESGRRARCPTLEAVVTGPAPLKSES